MSKLSLPSNKNPRRTEFRHHDQPQTPGHSSQSILPEQNSRKKNWERLVERERETSASPDEQTTHQKKGGPKSIPTSPKMLTKMCGLGMLAHVVPVVPLCNRPSQTSEKGHFPQLRPKSFTHLGCFHSAKVRGGAKGVPRRFCG